VHLLPTAILAIALLAACGTDADDGSDGADDGSDDADDGSDGSDDGDDAEPEGLQGTTAAHNQARAALGLDPLTWDPDLAAIAQAWVEQCIDNEAPLGLIDHNPDRSATYPEYVGENIYGTSGPAEGTEAVQLWLDEESSYDYDSNTCSAACGHYTQIVWSTTTKLGCAVHNCPALGFGNTVICDYAPGGNDGGRPY
jgi:pathogenesis-related protein 1